MEEKYVSKTTINGEEYNIKDEGAARAGELSEEIVNREASDNQLSAELAQKQDTLTESQLAAVNSGIDSAKVAQINANSENISSLDTSLDGVEEKIPAQATAENQLADKAFVNSSVQTATANFRGNWANFTAVPTDVAQYPADYAGQKTPTTNDYLVVQDASDFPVAEGEPALAGTWRFKYSGEWSVYGKTGWHPEYQVNETPLTAEQLAALNSGITAGAVTKLNNLPSSAELEAELDEKEDKLTFDATPTENSTNPVTSGGVFSALTGAGGIRTLTTADYNYHISGTEDNSVALWLLEPGIYIKPEGLYAYASDNTRLWDSTQNYEKLIIVTPVYGDKLVGITVFGGSLLVAGCWRVSKTTGVKQGFPVNNSNYYISTFLYSDMVIDNLTSYMSQAPLSANQGRVLKSQIGNLTSLTTSDTTDLVAAINELVTRVAALEGN